MAPQRASGGQRALAPAADRPAGASCVPARVGPVSCLTPAWVSCSLGGLVAFLFTQPIVARWPLWLLVPSWRGCRGACLLGLLFISSYFMVVLTQKGTGGEPLE